MKYMLMVCRDSSRVVTPEAGAVLGAAIEAWHEEMISRNMLVIAQRLEIPASAHTVRLVENAVLVTDGPFAETKEHIAGFDVLECASEDEALEVASHHPMLRYAAIEVRAYAED